VPPGPAQPGVEPRLGATGRADRLPSVFTLENQLQRQTQTYDNYLLDDKEAWNCLRPSFRQSKDASILWSHHEEERDNARNNARCTQARKATHGLDG